MRSRKFVMFLCAASVLPVIAQGVPPSTKKGPSKEIRLHLDGGTLHVDACSDSVIHVVFAPGKTNPVVRVPVALEPCSQTNTKVKDEKGELTLSTPSLRV